MLTPEDKELYKGLYNILSEASIGDLFDKYAKKQYNIAINKLKKATDIQEIGRLQGQIEANEAFLSLKDTCLNILKGL